jgi:F0F1-type ATP synthase assembly protein I
MGQVPPDNSSAIWRHVYAGSSLAVTILICTFGGIWIDKHWNCRPWATLVGAFVGIGAGLYNFIREFTHDSTDSGQGT